MASDFNSCLKALNKKFGTGTIKVGIEYEEYEKLPFKSPRLNYMTYGGLPEKRVIEFSGAEGSGKTTTALDIVAQAQKKYPKRKVMFVDIENTYDTRWAKLMGVNSDDLVLYRPDTQSAEEVFQTVLEVIDTGYISLVVIDSLGAMVSQQQNEKEIGEKTYAGISGSLTTFSKKVVGLLNIHNCTLIAINQLRENLNDAYGGETTPGGKAWKHACTVRLMFRMGAFIDEKGNQLTRGAENPAGNFVVAKVTKSKIFRSDRRIGHYTLNYLNGIDYISDLIDVAVKYGVIEQGGSWFNIAIKKEQFKFQGKPKLIKHLKENPKHYEELLKQLETEQNKED